MLLSAQTLLEERDQLLLNLRSAVAKTPGLALIWVGEDAPTAAFVRVKQKKAQELNVDFFLHHFEQVQQRQLAALIDSLNQKKEVKGIVLQLPLPKGFDTDSFIDQIIPSKDIDGLKPDSAYVAPTAAGIIALLDVNHINPKQLKTVIIGAGRLVGMPLAKLFKQRGWPFLHIARDAEKRVEEIHQAQLTISCTGQPGLITPTMVTKDSIVIDGSGVDVDTKTIEPLVKAVTPKKGAIGPLTVSYLFENLLIAAQG